MFVLKRPPTDTILYYSKGTFIHFLHIPYFFHLNDHWTLFCKISILAVASVAQLVGALSQNGKVEGLIPSQGAFLGCEFNSRSRGWVQMISPPGTYGRQPISAFLSHIHVYFSFPSCLSSFLEAMKKCPQVRIFF